MATLEEAAVVVVEVDDGVCVDVGVANVGVADVVALS